MPKTEPTPRPTREELDRWEELEKQRLALNRQAKDVGDLQAAIEEKVAAYVRENGGRGRVCVVCDHRLALELRAGRVDWKGAYVNLAGADEAEKLRKAAPQTEA